MVPEKAAGPWACSRDCFCHKKASERFREVSRGQALEFPQLTALLTVQGLPSPQVSRKQRSRPALLPGAQATN